MNRAAISNHVESVLIDNNYPKPPEFISGPDGYYLEIVENKDESCEMRIKAAHELGTLGGITAAGQHQLAIQLRMAMEDALQRSIHSLQDVFPVVRGANLVGAVSRQGIVEALQADGNGYVQGVMTRSFQTAQPDDSLVKTLRRIATGQGAQLVPVMEGDRIVGIITPQNLAHSMTMLNQRRRMRERDRAADRNDER